MNPFRRPQSGLTFRGLSHISWTHFWCCLHFHLLLCTQFVSIWPLLISGAGTVAPFWISCSQEMDQLAYQIVPWGYRRPQLVEHSGGRSPEEGQQTPKLGWSAHTNDDTGGSSNKLFGRSSKHNAFAELDLSSSPLIISFIICVFNEPNSQQ